MSKFEFNIQNTFLVLQGNLHFSNSCMMMNVFLKKLGDQCDFTNKKFQGATKILPKPVTKKSYDYYPISIMEKIQNLMF